MGYGELTVMEVQTIANGGTSKSFFGTDCDDYGLISGCIPGDEPMELIAVECGFVHGGDVDEAQVIDFQSVAETSEVILKIGGDEKVRGVFGGFPSDGVRVTADQDPSGADLFFSGVNGGGSRLLAAYPLVPPRKPLSVEVFNPSDTDVAGNTKVFVRLRMRPWSGG